MISLAIRLVRRVPGSGISSRSRHKTVYIGCRARCTDTSSHARNPPPHRPETTTDDLINRRFNLMALPHSQPDAEKVSARTNNPGPAAAIAVGSCQLRLRAVNRSALIAELSDLGLFLRVT
jgi:hypothetical protein